MRLSAVLLVAFLEREGLLPEHSSEAWRVGTNRITSAGDLGLLLEGRTDGKWQETIAVHPVRKGDGSRWQPDRSSPLLLLGDSFTNVFSLPELGWGEEAGLAETLSQSLGFAVDCLSRNAYGASASRAALGREAGRLDGKKVVVWQLAARELSFGSWWRIGLPREGEEDAAAASMGTIEIEGTLAEVAEMPDLARTPYRQAVMEFRLTGVKSSASGVPDEVVLLGMGVLDRVPTPIAKWKVGRRVKLRVKAWRSVEERFGRLPRIGLDDPDLELIEAVRFWMVDHNL